MEDAYVKMCCHVSNCRFSTKFDLYWKERSGVKDINKGVKIYVNCVPKSSKNIAVHTKTIVLLHKNLKVENSLSEMGYGM